MKEILAIIPARGGSVRTPKKNIKMLNGKPLLAYAIEAAKASEYITRIVVSTDDDEIADTAIAYGVRAIDRPEHLCGDCPTEDVVLDVIKDCSPDIVVCLEPPQPFRTAEHIDDCIEWLINDEFADSCATIHKISERPEWVVRLASFDIGGTIIPYTSYWKEDGIIRSPASQEFEELYYINGIVFACKTETLLKYKSMIGKRCIGVVTERADAFDLDYPEDFEICEMIMKRRGK